jgi:GT2 family glycosyltransferase
MSSGTAPRLAVIIVSWNVRQQLDQCLTALDGVLRDANVDEVVWVVDNGSTDGSAAMVRESHAWVHLEAVEDNLGYVRANNLALAALAGQADYYWLLNPDTVPLRGSVSTLLAAAESRPRAGLLGPKLLNPDRSLQECAFRFPGLLQVMFALEIMPQRFYFSRLNGRYPLDQFRSHDPFAIDHPLGAAMWARATAVREVGLLDEGFVMYCEEIDWAWRMAKAGWQSYLVPTSEVVHLGGASANQVRPRALSHLWASRARLYRKHASPLTRALARVLVTVVFRSRLRKPESPAWSEAYSHILTAWQLPGARR